ncbi:hypothetical protein KCV03_g180, partial [Aureobasidium melanogenum]
MSSSRQSRSVSSGLVSLEHPNPSSVRHSYIHQYREYTDRSQARPLSVKSATLRSLFTLGLAFVMVFYRSRAESPVMGIPFVDRFHLRLPRGDTARRARRERSSQIHIATRTCI